jgi:hypothetical protein
VEAVAVFWPEAAVSAADTEVFAVVVSGDIDALLVSRWSLIIFSCAARFAFGHHLVGVQGAEKVPVSPIYSIG